MYKKWLILASSVSSDSAECAVSVKTFQPISGQQQPRPAKSRPRQETSVKVEGSSASKHQPHQLLDPIANSTSSSSISGPSFHSPLRRHPSHSHMPPPATLPPTTTTTTISPARAWKSSAGQRAA